MLVKMQYKARLERFIFLIDHISIQGQSDIGNGLKYVRHDCFILVSLTSITFNDKFVDILTDTFPTKTLFNSVQHILNSIMTPIGTILCFK